MAADRACHTLLFRIQPGLHRDQRSQFVFLLPLRFLPFAPAKSLYDAGIRFSKGAFGTLLSKCLSPLGFD
jgi:hypothetical protein